MPTEIEWTDETWNPVTGCDEISPGCDHCYAKVFAERFRGVRGHHFEQGFDLVLRPERLGVPARWRKPRRVFVNSMSDLFHKDVPDAFIVQVFEAMITAPQHIYQVLTKRAKRLARFAAAHPELFRPHIWIGVTVENDAYAWRADYLRRVPAAVRFISAEPLLGAVPSLDLTGIGWVIIGGESGAGARPMHPLWATELIARCEAAGVAVFYKQHGAWKPVCWMSGDEMDALYEEPPEGSLRPARCKVPTISIQYDGREGFRDVDGRPGHTLFWVGKKAAGRVITPWVMGKCLPGRTYDGVPTAVELEVAA